MILLATIKNKVMSLIEMTFPEFLSQQAKFTFTVRAVDGGSPSALHADVDVELSVVNRNNKPPVWEHSSYGPIYVKENAQAGSDVISVRARFGESKRSQRWKDC